MRGIWPLYRYDPRRVEQGEAPLVVDAPGGKLPVQEYMRGEARFRMVERLDPEAFKRNAKRAQLAAERRMALYKHLAELRFQTAATSGAPAPTPEPVAADSKQS